MRRKKKKKKDQNAEANRCIFSFDFKKKEKKSEDECLGVMRADLRALLFNNYANVVIGILLPGACIYNKIIQNFKQNLQRYF